ncbi:MAG: hypothetical protein AAB257_07515, partial [Nitrospinota bacterium]
MTVSGTTIVGNAGEGTFNQSGGTHTTGSLTLGTQFGGTGTYNLSGGDLTTSGGAVIGEGGRGIVNQSGGRYSTGSVVLGRTADGYGEYNLSGTGNLDNFSGNTIVGNSGRGVFNQSDGTHTAGGSLVLGQNVGSSGEYNLSGGTLSSSFTFGAVAIVGQYGTGVFNQSGGTNTASLYYLGLNVGGGGTYNLTGGNLNAGLSAGEAGMGVFRNSGGTHNVNGNLALGIRSTGVGVYELLSGGNLVNPCTTIIGMDGDGRFIQSGGTHSAANLRVGQRAGTGRYDLSDGTLTVAGDTVVGGKLGSAAIGTFNQSGGTLTTAQETAIGYLGTGTFNQTGGMHTTGSLVLGREAGSAGSYDLSGASSSLAVSENTTVGN